MSAPTKVTADTAKLPLMLTAAASADLCEPVAGVRRQGRS